MHCFPDGPTPGRLTQDLDPPSFDSLASLMSGVSTADETDEFTRAEVDACCERTPARRGSASKDS